MKITHRIHALDRWISLDKDTPIGIYVSETGKSQVYVESRTTYFWRNHSSPSVTYKGPMSHVSSRIKYKRVDSLCNWRELNPATRLFCNV